MFLKVLLVALCSDGSRDLVNHFLRDLDKICRNRNEKCVLKRTQNGGKSISTQMGVAYMGSWVITQGIQGKGNFDFTMCGLRVIGQKVKCAVIATPWGQRMKFLLWLIFKIIMNLLTKCWHFGAYGLRGENTWIWGLAFSHSTEWGPLKHINLLLLRHPLFMKMETLLGVHWLIPPRCVIHFWG